jgi:ankyrin repeat protein
MSHNENYQRPLHFAVRMNRPQMASLLIELGADPLAIDGSGYPAAVYAMAPDIDRSAMEAIRARGRIDLVSSLALGEWDTAARLLHADPNVIRAGALHILAKRGDVAAVQWLVDRGADPNARWSHWDSDVTPLHLAVLGGHSSVVRILLEGKANPRIRDTKHDSDALGWADFFKRDDIMRMLERRDSTTEKDPSDQRT